MFCNQVLRLGCCVASFAFIGSKVACFSNSSKNDRKWTFEHWGKNVTSLKDKFALVLNVYALCEEGVNVKPWDWNWDGRHSVEQNSNLPEDSEVQQKVKRSRHLLFIRHGQYHYAKDDADCYLTGLGRQQLDCTGLRLKELNFPYRKVYYSTMTRAVESAELILNHLPNVPAEPLDTIREGAPYVLEPPLAYYKPTPKDLQEDGSRIESAFKNLVHRADADQETDTYEVFVCHANVIRYFVCRALQFPPEAWIRFSLDHGSITWIVIRPDGRVTLRWLGNSGYMPPDLISVQ
ncbi:unnamed protein product [Heterobilharzia americana]|nr:unnamed protein product [Heterobilharzia americana]